LFVLLLEGKVKNPSSENHLKKTFWYGAVSSAHAAAEEAACGVELSILF